MDTKKIGIFIAVIFAISVFALAVPAFAENAAPEELSGVPDFTKVVKQQALSKNTAYSEASTILVAVAASEHSNTLEHDALVSTLNSMGYNTVDVTTVAEAQTAGANVIFACVGCYEFDPAELNNWISSGKGYIQVGDWTAWFTNSCEDISEGNTVTVTITDSSHSLAAGLPASWVGRGFWAYGYDGTDYVGWSSGYDEVGTLQAAGYPLRNEGISVTTHGSGRAVYFGFNVYGAAAGPNELQLLINAINWVAQVQPAPVPTLTPIGLIALVGLLSGIAALSIRKRKR